MEISTLLEICQGEVLNEYNKKYKKIKNIKLNSREVKKTDLFVALPGQKFDGHDFINEAISKGANAVVVDRDVLIDTDVPIIKVNSTFEVLTAISKYKRELYNIPLIAVTGSVGKTMTKDLIVGILSNKYKVLKSQKSNNNHIGVPKTLFNLNSNHQIIVLELGMNHEKEISKLSKICKPNVAVITNIGTSHIGNLGSKRKILSAKLEILEGMSKGKLIINGDDKHLKKIKSPDTTIISCGINNNNQLIAYDIKSSFSKTTFKIKYKNLEYLINFNVPGIHLINNVLLAIQVGLEYNVPVELIIKSIENFKAGDKRMNIKTIKKNSILIEDCYNSSYESLVGVLDLIKKKPLNKIIILGDILELGKYGNRIHRKVGHYLSSIHNKTVLLVGEKMKIIKKNNLHFNNNKELIEHLKNIDLSNSIILVKGSRAMELEEITDYLQKI